MKIIKVLLGMSVALEKTTKKNCAFNTILPKGSVVVVGDWVC